MHLQQYSLQIQGMSIISARKADAGKQRAFDYADIAAIFPTSEAVNEALRVLAMAAQNLPHITPQRPPHTP